MTAGTDNVSVGVDKVESEMSQHDVIRQAVPELGSGDCHQLHNSRPTV